jgi:hypothetical protein
MFALILPTQLKALGFDNYLMEDILVEEYTDIELSENQVAFIYKAYFEFDGYAVVQDRCSKIEIAEGNCMKDSYNDAYENIKTYTYEKITLLRESFCFSGTGKNPFLKFILVTRQTSKT